MTEHSDKPRGRIFRRIMLSIAALLAAAALALIAGLLFAPDFVERTLGDAKVEVQRITQGEELSHITLGPEGGQAALDTAADREFIEMPSYRMDDVPPVFAAHNNRGGDVILSWDIGQEVKVTLADGTEGVYTVVEERFTPKWDDVSLLKGMQGPIVVQTCLYGRDEMRFLSLAPVE